MPDIFISVSNQQHIGANGQTEQQIASAFLQHLLPILEKNNISYKVGISGCPIDDSKQCKNENAKCCIVLHTNFSSLIQNTSMSGAKFYFSPTNAQSQQFAHLLKAYVKGSCTQPGQMIYQLKHSCCPTVLAELCYADNTKDLNNFTANSQDIATKYAKAICMQLSKPFSS